MVNGSNKSTLLCIPPVSYCRPKHPTKVHVWAGISMKGRTGICIFDGIMKEELYVEILDETLLPFLHDKFGDSNYRFMQDNDPKHVARLTRAWLQENEVNWWQTPPESPDINPIENLWHELKGYIQ